MRVVIADDAALVRSGLVMLLERVGIEIVGEASDAEGLMALVDEHAPDAAIVDIRMPPTFTDEGLVAARRIRDLYPAVAVLLLSQHLDIRYAERLLAEQPEGLGYLLKERVSDIAVLADALHRVAAGECVLDPSIVSQLMRERRGDPGLASLTPREREVLGEIAEGRSNSGIAFRLGIGERTVESLCAQVFQKLGLEASPHDNRRVLATLRMLRR
jgi:DNA-binding NarL/FixJ family response regulator